MSVGQDLPRVEPHWPVLQRADGPEALEGGGAGVAGGEERVAATEGLGDHSNNLGCFSSF